MYEEEYEETLSLTDIAAYILHHWKPIMILGIVFMIVVGGLLSFKDYATIQTKYGDETYSSMIQDLTESQVSNAQQFYKRYQTYKQRIADNQFYLDNSLKMKIDPNKVSVYTVQYLVSSDYQGIINSFTSAALDLDDYEEMAKIMDGSVDARYMNELVYLSGDVQQEAFDIDTDKVGDVINGNISNTYKGVLNVNITSNGRDTCEKLAEVADRAIQAYYDKLKATGVNAEIKQLTTSYSEKVDMTLAEFQRTQSDQGADLVQGFYKFETDAKDSLDEDEFAVFEYLIQKEEQVTDKIHWKRWGVVGLAGGLFLGFVIYLISYLAIPGVKTSDEIEHITDEKELGSVIQPAKYNFAVGKIFHIWANKIRFRGFNQLNDDESIAILSERITSNCSSKDAKSVFLLADADDEYTQQVVEKSVHALEGKGFKVNFGNPDSSVEALRALKDSDVAVHAITIMRSLSNSVRANKAICEENQIPVVGNVIIYPQG